MADSRGGLASVARNGNSAARTYGAGIRPRSRDDGPLWAAGGGGARTRTGSKTGGAAASAKTLASATAHVAPATAADRSPSAAGGDAAGGDAETGDADPDPSDADFSDADFSDADADPELRDPELRDAEPEPPAPRSSGGSLCAVRRTILLGVVAGGAALVAGCGGDDGDGDADAPLQAAQTSQPPSPGAGATEESLEPFPGADDGGGDTGGGDGLVKTGEVPVGGAVLVGNYLIAQPQRGVFKAFDATCPHQGITVDTPIGSNDYFICPGHNSKFRLADGGRISGPAPRGLKQVPVKVRNGFVVEA